MASILRRSFFASHRQRIKQYTIPTHRVDFYATNNQIFIVIREEDRDYPYTPRRISLAEFLVSDSQIPSNLPFDSSVDGMYTITKNQCFTFDQRGNSVRHQRLVNSTGLFETSTTIEVPHIINCTKFMKINSVQMCNSKLFVSVLLFDEFSMLIMGAVCEYKVTRHSYDKLTFSDPRIYHHNFTLNDFGPVHSISIRFDTDNIPVENSICSIHQPELDKWVSDCFAERFVSALSIYRHHVVIECGVKLIVFYGTLRQVMNHAVKNSSRSQFRHTVIDLYSLKMVPTDNDCISMVHINSRPKFLVITPNEVVTIDFNAKL